MDICINESRLWSLANARFDARPRHVILLLVVTLLAFGAPPALAAGCAEIFEGRWLSFPASNFLSGRPVMYLDSACQSRHNSLSISSSGMALASSYRGAISTCQAQGVDVNTANNPYINKKIWTCQYYGLPFTMSQGDRYLGNVSAPDAATARSLCGRLNIPGVPTPNYVQDKGGNSWRCFYIKGRSGGVSDGSSGSSIPICNSDINLPLTGLRLHAFDGMNSGIQFRRLNNCGVGDPAVFEMGFLDAVDVWSNIGSGFSVCFPQAGRIVFLDAATSPRTLIEIDNVIDQGQPCAAMDRAGTMVLVKTQAGTTTAPTTSTTRRPGTNDTVDDAIELEECTVTPRVNLRLRARPWGKILDVMPSNSELLATARTKSWFKVAYEETEGWSAAWLISSDANCDWSGL